MHASNNSHTRDLVVVLTVVVVVSAIGSGFDRLLVREGVPRVQVLVASNILTGIAVGLLYLQLRRIEGERRRAIQRQLRTIAEMNHHIRNALQIITYATAAKDQTESVDLIRTSVERIEWALREVLPGHFAEYPFTTTPEEAEQPTSTAS
jgi:hypothetical protein